MGRWLPEFQGPHRARRLGQAGQGARQGRRSRIYRRLRQEAAVRGETCLTTRIASSPISTASRTSPLKGAMARGHWDGTKQISREGPRLDHQRDEGVRPSRPWRRRLPDRPEVVLHAEGKRRPPALPRRQCRRIRARHLQGPRHHAPRSAYADRRLRDRLLRHGRARRLHLRARRIHARARGAAGGDRRMLRRRPARQEQQASAGTWTSLSITAPAPISAARKPRCWKASKARRASRA